MTTAMSEEKMVPCPRCGKNAVFSSENPHRPFCSERCQLIDLGKWANGDYRVPTADGENSEKQELSDDADSEDNES